jgi:hypothetical protein
MGVEILNKITMKAIGCQPPAGSVTEPQVLCHLFGTAVSFKTGSTNYGFFQKFRGDFKALNVDTGDLYNSPYLLVPELIETLIKDELVRVGATAGKVGNKSLQQAEIDGTDAPTPVEFHFEIGVKPAPKKTEGADKGSGYQYTVRTVSESKVADPHAHLLEAAQKARQLRLAGPKPKEKGKAT